MAEIAQVTGVAQSALRGLLAAVAPGLIFFTILGRPG